MHCPYCGAPIEIITAACPFCGAATLLGDRYEIRARIGRGGMGEVFRAYDRRLDTDVAIKRLPPQFSADPALRASLTHEAQLMARLSDAAIVRLFDLQEFAGSLYLILEFVPGPSLAAMLRAGYRASLEETARLLGDVCNGLRNAHRTGIIHRDLKPSNLLLALEGPDRAAFEKSQTLPTTLRDASVKIADFGIAKAVRESRATFTGEFVGTPGYTAPEQLQGAPASPATDIYALGALACEMLTATLPAGRAVIPNIPAMVSAVIVRACAFHPAQRYASAEEFYQALAAAIEGRAAPLRRPVVVPARGTTRRLAAVLAITFAILIAIGAAAYLSQPRKTQRLAVNPFEKIEDEPAMEFHAPPRADEPPPVIEAARGRTPSEGLLGPTNPKVKWVVKLPVTGGLQIAALGVDNTVYLTGMNHLFAVRDGELRWGFKLGMGVSGLRFDDEGRIWFTSSQIPYCLNRDGKGGRLPKSTPLPQEPRLDLARCVYGGNLRGRDWTFELETPCTTAGAISGPGGMAYAATESPEIFAVTPQGKMAWKATTACNAEHLGLLAHGAVFYTCKDQSIHALSAGKELWTAHSDGSFYNDFVSAADGVVFYGDYGRNNGETHVHALDASGRRLWSVDTRRVSMYNLALDQHRRLYVSGSSFNGRLLCLSD